jgi:DNA-directed RNA polymerase specialized sigma24 family protein
VSVRRGAAPAAGDRPARVAHLDRDRGLVEAAQRDPRQFDALYRRYLAQVYSYAYYELGDHHDAEDATERTFLAALTNLDRFEERARPADRRRALVLRFVDEMSTAEIAGVLGRSEGAVRVLIHRALRSVARELGTRGSGSGDPAR